MNLRIQKDLFRLGDSTDEYMQNATCASTHEPGGSQGMLPQEKVDSLRPVTGTTVPLKIGLETTSFIQKNGPPL